MRLLVVAFLFILCGKSSFAVETAINSGLDTWLRGTGGSGDDNKTAPEVLVGNISSTTDGRGVIEFDLSEYALAGGDSISAARIELTVSTKDSSTTTDLGNKPLEVRFVDDGGNTADLVNGATWINRSLAGPVAWTTAGGVFGATVKGVAVANPFTVTNSQVVTLLLSNLSGVAAGGKLQFGILSPTAEASGSTRQLYRFNSFENLTGTSVSPRLVLTTTQPLTYTPNTNPPAYFDLNIGGKFYVTNGTVTVTNNVLVGSGEDGFLLVDGGSLEVGGSMSLGTAAQYRNGILEYKRGSVSVGGDLDFSSTYLSGSVLRMWNPASNAPVAVGGKLTLERCVLTMRFDSNYVHTAGQVIPLVTYATRVGRFENIPADGKFNQGPNRFQLRYDVDAGGGLKSITATALENYSHPTNQPNIIFIVVDDQGYGELQPYGSNPAINPTPSLQTLASQGLLFTAGYASASVCSPTRGSFFTGRYCESVGHRQNIDGNNQYEGLSPVFTSYLTRLAAVGYRNYWVGKWYLGTSAERMPLQRGVDRYFSQEGGLSHLAGTDTLVEDENVLGTSTKYLTDHCGDKVIQYIGDHLTNHPGEPFSVVWSDFAPHSPYNADPARLQRIFGVKGSYTTTEKIAGMNLAIDDNVGRLLEFLDNPDGDTNTADSIAANTVIVYSNDNGGTTSHNNGILRGTKGDQFEGGIRVPLIARWPGTLAPGTFTKPTHMLDWIATFCSVAGVPVHERSELEGLDLMSILQGAVPYPDSRPLFWNLWPRWIAQGEWAGGMRQGDWKLMVAQDLSQTMLFNLVSDPSETTDVKDANMAVHNAMLEIYKKWQRYNVMASWNEGFNPGIITVDSGLYWRCTYNGYRFSNRSLTPKYYTTEARPFFNLGNNFELTCTLAPRSPEDVNANSKAWIVFGPNDSRSTLVRVGVNFGASALTIEDLGGGGSVSTPMPLGWTPASGAALTIRYNGSSRSLSVSSGTSVTNLTIPAGTAAWQKMGFGVQSFEADCAFLRDNVDLATSSVSNLTPGSSGSTMNVTFDRPSGRPIWLETSTNLTSFTEDKSALIENLAPGHFRVSRPASSESTLFFRAADGRLE